MHAICTDAYGAPEVLSLQEIPTPSLAPGEYSSRSRRHPSTPRRLESSTWRGTDVQWSDLPPRVLGADFSGKVVTCGPGTRDFKPGDEVFGWYAFKGGAYAEYVKVTSQNIARKPPSNPGF